MDVCFESFTYRLGDQDLPNAFLVLDRSCSMTGQAWEDLEAALAWLAVEYDEQVNFGARFVPGLVDPTQICSTAVDVPLGPGRGSAMLAAANGSAPENGTPVYPGVVAGLDALRLQPRGSRIMVLLSDGGSATSCVPGQDSVRDAIARLLERYRLDHEITTYVVGLGANVDMDMLNAWARAGGAPQGNVNIDYLAADELTSLRSAFGKAIGSTVLGCRFALSPKPSMDVARIEVEVGGTRYLAAESQAPSCPDETAGFEYPNAPQKDIVELCNAACEAFRESGAVELTYICWSDP